MASLRETIARYDDGRRGLAARYDEGALPRLDIDDAERQWREANATFWPNGMLARRRVQKLLQGFVAEGTADPDTDLKALRILAEARAEAARNPLAEKPLAFAGVATNLKALAETAGLLV